MASTTPLSVLAVLLVSFAGLANVRAASPPPRSAPPPRAPATLFGLLSTTPELRAALNLFNYTGLLPLTQDPKTMITCFLPSNKYLDDSNLVNGWDSYSPGYHEQRGRYVWAILLHHCLDMPKALTVAKLKNGTYQSAFVWRAQYDLVTSSVRIRKLNGVTYFSGEQGPRAKLIKADLKGGKSIVHIIDSGNVYPSFAPSDSWDTVSGFLSNWFGEDSATARVFAASSMAAALDNPVVPFTIFAPGSAAFENLLAKLNVTLEALLAKQAVVDMIVKTHVVLGETIFTGELISYPNAKTIMSASGPINATTDFAFLPNHKAGVPAKFLTLSTLHSSANVGDYDVGGNSNDVAPPLVPWVSHFVDNVLLPRSVSDIKAML